MKELQISTWWQKWFLAIRPKTLPASVTPVLVGSAIACRDGNFSFLPAVAALLGSLLLQIGVNLANDYFDFKKGYDTPDRIGPVRVTASGIIALETMKKAIVLVFSSVVLVGIYLIWVGGWPIMVIGVASILAALTYSGGPYPLASHGLGDVFVFIFFGLIAVSGSYYVQTLTLTPYVVAAAFPVGCLITAILVVNNLRDIWTDAQVGKRTLAVRIGEKGSRFEFAGLISVAFVATMILWHMTGRSIWLLLPLASIPFAVRTLKRLLHSRGPVLNEVLASTAYLSFLYGILLSAGFILSK